MYRPTHGILVLHVSGLLGFVLFYLTSCCGSRTPGRHRSWPGLMCAVNNEMDIGAIRLIIQPEAIRPSLCRFQKQAKIILQKH